MYGLNNRERSFNLCLETARHNVVQSRKFSEMLERSLLAYQNRTLEAAEVTLELINMAREMRDAPKRGEELGLTDDELAFYDALADHGNVRDVMSDETLSEIAHDLVEYSDPNRPVIPT